MMMEERKNMSETKTPEYDAKDRIKDLVSESESAIRKLKLRLDSVKRSRKEFEAMLPSDVASQLRAAKAEMAGARGYLARDPEKERIPSEFIQTALEELIGAHQYALQKLEEKYGNGFDAVAKHNNAITLFRGDAVKLNYEKLEIAAHRRAAYALGEKIGLKPGEVDRIIAMARSEIGPKDMTALAKEPSAEAAAKGKQYVDKVLDYQGG